MQEHGGAEDGADRIRNTLARDVERGPVDGLAQPGRGLEGKCGGDAERARERRGQQLERAGHDAGLIGEIRGR